MYTYIYNTYIYIYIYIYKFIYIYVMHELRHWRSIASMSPQSLCGDEED